MVKISDEMLDRLDKKRKEENENYPILIDYFKDIDKRLIELGFDKIPAKSVEYGKTDQPMLNHIRLGILFLERMNYIIKKEGLAPPIHPDEFRKTIALFVLHDIHKIENINNDEFEISKEIVEKYLDEIPLQKFAPTLTIEDYQSVVTALHKFETNKGKPKHSMMTSSYIEVEPLLKMMDAFASLHLPEEVSSQSTQVLLNDAFPEDDLYIHYHRLQDVKGVLTELIHKGIENVLETKSYFSLLNYEDGYVYLSKEKEVPVAKNIQNQIYQEVKDLIPSYVPRLSRPKALQNELGNARLGFYKIEDEYFFFSNPDKIIHAFVSEALTGTANLTESREKDMEKALSLISKDLKNTNIQKEQILRFSIIISTLNKIFLQDISQSNDKERIRKIGKILTIEDFVEDYIDIIKKVECLDCGVEFDLGEKKNCPNCNTKYQIVSGGKWGHGYPLAFAFLNKKIEGDSVKNKEKNKQRKISTSKIINGLKKLDGWEDFLEKKTQLYKNELQNYIKDNLVIDGKEINSEFRLESFKEEDEKGKICSICNRPAGNLRKSDMGVRTDTAYIGSGFSNRIGVGKQKPQNMYKGGGIPLCLPCRLEFTLRNNGFSMPNGDARSGDLDEVLYIHLIPDYYKTDVFQSVAKSIMDNFNEEARTRMKNLSIELLREDGTYSFDHWEEILTSRENGRRMVQSLIHGFDGNIGPEKLSYYKPSKNETEFHFFGAYLGLIISAFTGMRCLVSPSPIPPLKGRDFQEMVYLDSLNNSVEKFFGKKIPLSKLDNKLISAASIILMGYATTDELKDSLLPKYLRIVRNNPLPGSKLLKMVGRNADSSSIVNSSISNDIDNTYLNLAKIIDNLEGDKI